MCKRIFLLFLFLFQFHSSVFSADRAFYEKIGKIISRVPGSTLTGLLIYNPMTKDTLYQINKFKSMIPASNTKLFTTATAISELGGDFLISTKIFSDDKDINGGVINGNIYLKGYGNGLFTSADLEQMIRELKKAGITKITGKVIGDDTYFDNVYWRDDWIDDEAKTVDLPPISALVLNRNYTYEQIVRKKKVIGSSTKMLNPPIQIAGIFRNRLIAAGISVGGGASWGITPPNARLLSTYSVKLKNFIAAVNKHSDNFLAECLFKIIGAEKCKCQGNAFYATQAVLTFIAENGIYSKGTKVVDGSGLSRYNNITPAALVGILEKMYFDLRNFDDFYNSLSIAGRDGTLRGRMGGNNKACNNMHGKTGTLNGVSSLTGYVKNAKGDDILMSVLFDYKNGSNALYHAIQDAIAGAVAESY